MLLFWCLFSGLNAWSVVKWLSLEFLSFKVLLPNCDTLSFSLRESSRVVICEFVRSRTIEKWKCNFRPQLLSMKLVYNMTQIRRFKAPQMKALHIACNGLRSPEIAWDHLKPFGNTCNFLGSLQSAPIWGALERLQVPPGVFRRF